MEHQVFVPVPVPALRRTLGDPVRVARCVPGIQQDADAAAAPLAGRLKFRAGGHTITYRGELKLSGPGPRYSVTGEGVEARGTGAVKLALTIALTETDGGTTLAYSGTASGDGRLAELAEGAALAAAQRLLDRFTQQLVTETLAAREGGGGVSAEGGLAPESGPEGGGAVDGGASEDGGAEDVSAEGLEGDVEGAGGGVPGGERPGSEPSGSQSEGDAPSGDEASAGTGAVGEAASAGTDAGDEPAGSGEPAEPASVFDSPVPPPALDPVAGVEFTVPDEPPAEAAHARRTMIGRSAEEVDHAPPRGRYAPVPSPDAGGAGTTLRWVAPAAALALASAVVLGRALRRRR
ncbi:CoxG family protein [Streptomyces sp. YIM 132580]|uniref:CoxG family protein n=1 Tax=Streptomyces sp. YIM 132580 TaxID=2691958 RepID=UPI0013682C24|nr:SRPBCC domain-containing protein [Streptomyces sp. YIM 132580]MXG27195.1 carbon monoxide dehydrogenase [Streptomyces sp. YIM 132580]